MMRRSGGLSVSGTQLRGHICSHQTNVLKVAEGTIEHCARQLTETGIILVKLRLGATLV